MKLNRKDSFNQHIVDINGKPEEVKDIVAEERPSVFSDVEGEDEAGDVADLIIRQNQIVNRALRRTYRSRVARKAI
jgi:hypothetical protein|tara:strand:- start:407 stop:634 length:228 start_codon:yes stop_codon:yes gene_type:complete